MEKEETRRSIKDRMIEGAIKFKRFVRREYLEDEIADLEKRLIEAEKKGKEYKNEIERTINEKDREISAKAEEIKKLLEKEKEIKEEKKDLEKRLKEEVKTAEDYRSEREELRRNIIKKDDEIERLKDDCSLLRSECGEYKKRVEFLEMEKCRLSKLADEKYKDWRPFGTAEKDGETFYIFRRKLVGCDDFQTIRIPSELNLSDMEYTVKEGYDIYVYIYNPKTRRKDLKMPFTLHEFVINFIESTLTESYGVDKVLLKTLPRKLALLTEFAPKKPSSIGEEMLGETETTAEKIYRAVREKGKIGEEVTIAELEAWTGIPREKLHMALSRMVKKGLCVRGVKKGVYVFK